MYNNELQALKEAMEPVRVLASGSDMIEQMRKQIKRVLQIIAGNLPTTEAYNSAPSFVFYLDKNDAGVQVVISKRSAAICVIGPAQQTTRYQVNSDSWSLPLHLVIPVFKSLPRILEEALKNDEFKKSYQIFKEAHEIGEAR